MRCIYVHHQRYDLHLNGRQRGKIVRLHVLNQMIAQIELVRLFELFLVEEFVECGDWLRHIRACHSDRMQIGQIHRL